jgi:hypothetical protein
VKGRQILDNIILVQEAIHTSCKKKEKGMVIKLDLANAFDRVRHDFLFAVMMNFGFNQKFIEWVKACITSPLDCPFDKWLSCKFFPGLKRAKARLPSLPRALCHSSLGVKLPTAEMSSKQSPPRYQSSP